MRKIYTGIYAICNKVNGKLYIGSARNAIDRWQKEHLPILKKNKHYNRHLQHAWNKYGESAFEFLVLEECGEALLVEREGYWIEYHKSWDRSYGYNLNRHVDGRVVMSNETRRLMSEKTTQSWQDQNVRAKRCQAIKESITGEIRESLAAARREDYKDPEYRAAHSAIMAATWTEQRDDLRDKMKAAWSKPEVRRSHEHTTENKKKMSEASKQWWAKNARPVLQLTLDGKLVREWPSPLAAIREYGNHVSSVLNGKRPHCRGYNWRYK